jgi:hypothetical protein
MLGEISSGKLGVRRRTTERFASDLYDGGELGTTIQLFQFTKGESDGQANCGTGAVTPQLNQRSAQRVGLEPPS